MATVSRMLVVLGLLVGGAVLAGPRVVVLDVTEHPAAQWRAVNRQAIETLAQGLAAGQALKVLPQHQVEAFFAEPPDPKAGELVAKAEEQLALGREHSTRLKPDKAIKEFSAALRNLRAVFAHLPGLSALAEAHLQRGMTYQALGKGELADREYRMVLLLEPDRQLDDAMVSPLVIERFEQVRSELVTSMKGSVSLLSTPDGARVLMDGRQVGFTPITIPGVLPGEHYFSIHHPGYRTWFGVLTVPAGGVEKQEVFMVEGSRYRLWRQRMRLGAPEADPLAAAELAEGLGADWLVLVSFSHPGGQALATLKTWQRGGGLEPLGVFPVGRSKLAPLAAKLLRWIGGDRSAFAAPKIVRTPDLPPPGQDPPPSAGPAWYERWWVWTIVGAAVVGAATATTVVLLDRDSGIQVDVYR